MKEKNKKETKKKEKTKKRKKRTKKVRKSLSRIVFLCIFFDESLPVAHHFPYLTPINPIPNPEPSHPKPFTFFANSNFTLTHLFLA